MHFKEMIIVFEKEFKKKRNFSSFRFQVQNKKIISVLKKIYVCIWTLFLKRSEHTYNIKQKYPDL